jgi:hypothetical protein
MLLVIAAIPALTMDPFGRLLPSLLDQKMHVTLLTPLRLGVPLPLPGESESQRYLPGLPVTRHLEGLCVWTHTHKHTHCQERECAQVGSVTTREGFTMVYNKTKHTHRVLHKYNPRHTRLSRRAGVWHGAYPPLNLMDTVTTYMNYKTALSF